jgi:hypothetical protein
MGESQKLIDQLNQLVPDGHAKLKAPDLKFNRSIGEHVGKPYSVAGELLSPQAYQQHLLEALPMAQDEQALAEIIKGKDWVAQMQVN